MNLYTTKINRNSNSQMFDINKPILVDEKRNIEIGNKKTEKIDKKIEQLTNENKELQQSINNLKTTYGKPEIDLTDLRIEYKLGNLTEKEYNDKIADLNAWNTKANKNSLKAKELENEISINNKVIDKLENEKNEIIYDLAEKKEYELRLSIFDEFKNFKTSYDNMLKDIENLMDETYCYKNFIGKYLNKDLKPSIYSPESMLLHINSFMDKLLTFNLNIEKRSNQNNGKIKKEVIKLIKNGEIKQSYYAESLNSTGINTAITQKDIQE